MTDLNMPGSLEYDSYLEEQISAVLERFGAVVQTAPVNAPYDLVAVVKSSEGPINLTIDVRTAPSVRPPRPPADARTHVTGLDHVTPGRAEKYRAADRFFVDASGNAWIDLPGFHIDVQGRRRPQRRSSRVPRGHAFGPAGLRVVFSLLVKPELAARPVRAIADTCGVSTGSVHATLSDLEDAGFLLSHGPAHRSVRDIERLTDLWLSNYATRLAPRLDELNANGPEPEWWLNQTANGRTDLSGGAAIAAMGYGFKPVHTLIYGTPPWIETRKSARLTVNESGTGNVVLRERFWSDELIDERGIAPALLVYADALASDDPREHDVAELLWNHDDHLRRLRDSG